MTLRESNVHKKYTPPTNNNFNGWEFSEKGKTYIYNPEPDLTIAEYFYLTEMLNHQRINSDYLYWDYICRHNLQRHFIILTMSITSS